jgi:predicted nucleic acid-binding protein
VDTTVWSKARSHEHLREWFNAAVKADLVLTCDVVVLEVLKSARDARAYAQQVDQLGLLRVTPMDADVHARAREVQGLLAASGHHRGVPPADLLIAASAELAGVAVVHYDHDYDLIASETGQPTRWVAPAGAVP